MRIDFGGNSEAWNTTWGLIGVFPHYTRTGQQLQESADDLQNRMGDVLLASMALGEKLDAPAASLIQSECRLLSRSIVQLQRRTSGQAQSLKVISFNMAVVF